MPLVGCSAADDVADAGAKGAGEAADDVAPTGTTGTTGESADRYPNPHGDSGVVAIGGGRTGGRGIRLFVASNARASTVDTAVVEYSFSVENDATVNAAVLSRDDYDELTNGVVDPAHEYHLLIERRSAGRARGTVPVGEYVLFFWTPIAAGWDGTRTPISAVIDFEDAVTYRD